MAKAQIFKDSSYFFLKSIKSSWKGYEDFAIWLVQEMSPGIIVDLGIDVGLSTCAFAFPNIGRVYGIDWFDENNFTRKTCALDTAFKNISELSKLRNLKNVHIIIGDYNEVVEGWKESIDILHVDYVTSYDSAKSIYDNWHKFMKKNGVILLHDVEKERATIGRFFEAIDLPKLKFQQSNGLGVLSRDEALLKKIQKRWKRNC